MTELLWGLVGFAVPFVLSWLFAKINPAAFAKWLSRLLAKVLKDERARNRVENKIGQLLINLGQAIIDATPEEGEEKN